MMKLGRRIYYDKTTGNVIYDRGESVGSVVDTTIENDIETLKVLSERNRETFDVIELKYGELSEDFQEATSYMVDTETKEIIFNYEKVELEPKYQKPLTEQLNELRQSQAEQDALLMELTFQNTL